MAWTLKGDLVAVGIGINWRRREARLQGLEFVGVRLGPLHYLRYCEQVGIGPPLPDDYGHGKPPVPVLLDTAITGIAPITRPLESRKGRLQSLDRSAPDQPQA
jgi:hypothetical protein